MPQGFEKEICWIIEEKYHGKITDSLKKDINRLKKGEPVDYIIGFSEFAGCRIDLSLRPLIPRPETEYWTEKIIAEIKNSGKKSPRVLDVFSGSGCIGIAVLKNMPRAKVGFVEKSKHFLEQIKINLELNKINRRRYRIVQSDIFSNVRGKYDYILANPPYIARSRIKFVQKSVLKWEPRSAIFAGNDGLAVIKKFLKETISHLNTNGKIFMEFDSFQKNKIASLLKECGYNQFEFHRDQFNKWRWVEILNL